MTISARQALRIVDPAATGSAHTLCLGADGHCDASAQGPDELHGPGRLLTSGDIREIGFPRAS